MNWESEENEKYEEHEKYENRKKAEALVYCIPQIFFCSLRHRILIHCRILVFCIIRYPLIV